MRLLSSDPVTKKAELWHAETDGSAVIETKQDVTDIIEANKADFNQAGGLKGDMHHVARIPLVVYEELMRKGIAGDPAALKRWLDHPDNRAFRTHPAKLSR